MSDNTVQTSFTKADLAVLAKAGISFPLALANDPTNAIVDSQGAVVARCVRAEGAAFIVKAVNTFAEAMNEHLNSIPE